MVYKHIRLHTNPSFNHVSENNGKGVKEKQGMDPALWGGIDLPDTCPAIPKKRGKGQKIIDCHQHCWVNNLQQIQVKLGFSIKYKDRLSTVSNV